VQFLDGTTVLATVKVNGKSLASFTTKTLTIGPHSITAVYIPSANISGNTSNSVSLTMS
jgi:hypothetical protein